MFLQAAHPKRKRAGAPGAVLRAKCGAEAGRHQEAHPGSLSSA